MTNNPPLAPVCSLCGDGYHPNLEISISDEPRETLGEIVYRWAHDACRRDHDRDFVEAFVETDGFAEYFDGDHA